MKLFAWRRVECLRNYARGQVIVLAETKEAAIELAVAQSESVAHKLRDELSSTQPEVLETPVAFVIWGSS
jgi:hypothetical protein